jgi:hypothetical protein
MARIVRRTSCLVLQLGLCACGSSSGGRDDDTGTGSDADTGTEGPSSASGVDDTTSQGGGSDGTTDPADTTGDDGPAEQPYGSGTRMLARVMDGGGGALRQSGWHDSELGLDCDIAVVADAGGRCVPGPIYGLSTFADPGCTQPVFIEWCDVPEYVVVNGTDPNACNGTGGVDVYRVGAAIVGDVYQPTGDACVAQPAFEGTYALDPVDPTMFAPFERELVDRGDGLATVVWRGDDGSYEWRGVHDTVRDGACMLWSTAPEACVPAERGFVLHDHHLDFACMDAGVGVSTHGAECGPPPVLEDGAMLYAPGAPIDPSALYHEDDGCQVGPGQLPFAWGLFEIGPALTAADFPSIVSTSQGTSRLRTTMLESPSGEAVAPYAGFWDTELALECYAMPTSAGVRCLPYSIADVRFWGDATCTTTQLHSTYVDVPHVDVLPVYGGADIFCTEPVSAVRLGAVWDQPVFFFDGKTCTPYEVYETDVFEVVEEQLDLTVFAAIEIIME